MSTGPEAQREAHRATVLGRMADGAPRTVAALRAEAGLSRPTVETILAELVADGWVRTVDVAPGPTAGRPPRRYAVAADAAHVAGVDVGVGKVVVLVADATGRERGRARIELPAGASGRQRRAAVRRAVREAVDAAGIGTADLAQLAVGVPGVVDHGVVTRSTVLPEWTGGRFGADLTSWADAPVVLVNDANLALLAEHHAGRARGRSDVVYLHAGVRTRAAIMIDGRLHRGRHGAAGEIGSVPQLFFDTPTLLLGPRAGGRTDVRPVFERAARGSITAERRVQAYGQALAAVISTLALALDPDLVVIGGGLSRAGAVITDAVRPWLAPDVAAPVELSTLGDEAVALGAVRHALLTAARSRPALAAITRTSIEEGAR